MKKVLLVGIVFILAGIAAGFLLPTEQAKQTTLSINCPAPALARYLTTAQKWKSWWPGVAMGDSSWQLEGKTFHITEILLNGFRALSEDHTVAIDLQFSPVNSNESVITLQTRYALPFHPVYRLWAWLSGGPAEKISNRLHAQCNDFFGNPKNVYGLDIKKGKVQYFSWMAAKNTFDHLPTTEETYQLIEALQLYIIEQKGVALSDPILHVHQEAPSTFELMVALPTDRNLPSTNRFQLKNMILGSLLTAEVKGGSQRVGEAERELENYVKDHQMVSPAIPFQTLITNRRLVQDSSQWITRVNYPIFN